MSIMRKLKDRDPDAGYAQDFVALMHRIFPACIERGIRVVANAGGVNPTGCAEAICEAGREAGVGGRARVGLVTGDDLMERLDDLFAQGHDLAHMETGEPLSAIRDRVRSANAYFGAAPLVEALARITPRTDARRIAEGVAALIDGLYIRRALKDGPPDPASAIALVEDYVDTELTVQESRR